VSNILDLNNKKTIIVEILSIIGIICIMIMMYFQTIMLKRTEYGKQMLGKIEGFKNFLSVTEKDRLQLMVNQYPTYFYEILPYTYVLGISDEWIEKFETIAMQSPTWYNGYNHSHFNTRDFGHFMDRTMSSATTAMSSTPDSGGSSGGGSSGGGSGGGGGGSW
jgi:uncharacterized membrane protein